MEQARRERRGRVREALREGPWFPRRPGRGALIALLAGIVGFVLVLALDSPASKGPPLATSCESPAIALGKPAAGGTVPYSITGPATGAYVVAVDAVTARVQGNGAVVTPKQAVAVAIHRGLHGCAAHGTAPPPPPGSQEMELFRDGVRVAQQKLP